MVLLHIVGVLPDFWLTRAMALAGPDWKPTINMCDSSRPSLRLFDSESLANTAVLLGIPLQFYPGVYQFREKNGGDMRITNEHVLLSLHLPTLMCFVLT